MSDNTTDHFTLTDGRRLVKNTLWNFLARGLPLLVALISIPILINGMGTERFGVLTIAWMVVGYFNLFDVGIGRALTKLVAEKLGAGSEGIVPGLCWTALMMMVAMGIVGALILALLTPWLIEGVLTIPAGLQQETSTAFYLLAAALPVVISNAGLGGILEAYQRFELAAIVRIPMGLWSFLGPLAVLPFSTKLCTIVSVIVVGRVVAWVAHLLLCLHVVPALRKPRFQRHAIKPLLSFGGWITVSNVIGPLMNYFDRFAIGAVLTMSAVAYYATPYTIVTRLGLIPWAVVGVLFPAFSSDLVCNRARAGRRFEQGASSIFLVMLPLTLLLVLFGNAGLSLWLDEEFAQHSVRVLQWLAIGVFINSLARVPFTIIQADGRADFTAKLHLLELPLYLVMLWWLLHAWGIVGAAIAWVIRIALDTSALYGFALIRITKEAPVMRSLLMNVVGAAAAMTMCLIAEGTFLEPVFILLLLAIYFSQAWKFILGLGTQNWLLQQLTSFTRRDKV